MAMSSTRIAGFAGLWVDWTVRAVGVDTHLPASVILRQARFVDILHRAYHLQ